MTRIRKCFRMHGDVLVFSIVAATIAVIAVILTGVRPSDLGILPMSGMLLLWAGSTVVLVGLVLALLYSRRQVSLERTKLRAFLYGAGDGIFAVDRAFHVMLWNPAAEAITGLPSSEAIGKPMREVVRLFRDRDRKQDCVFIEEAMKLNEQRSMTEPMYLLRTDGTEVPVAESAGPLHNDHGEVVGCVVIVRDISAERRHQGIHSEFAYASHQLRTPVTKALWALEIALERRRSKDENLQVAYASLRSVRKLVAEIVDVSEMDQRIVRPRLAAQDVSGVVAEVVRELSYEARACNVVLDTSDIPQLDVYADARMLRRVLHELLDNAIVYSREGGTVKVRARPDADGTRIQVCDSGIGITDEESPMVFSKFFRGSNFNTTTIPGAGLGLNIAKGYIELMHGRIWFTTKQSEGTTFFVQLPAAKAELT